MCACVCGDVPVDPVYALALIQTGHAGTFINVDLTVLALETSHALTRVHGHVVMAGGAILAGLHLTLIDLHPTVNPCRGQSRDGHEPRPEIGYTPNYLSTCTDTTQSHWSCQELSPKKKTAAQTNAA